MPRPPMAVSRPPWGNYSVTRSAAPWVPKGQERPAPSMMRRACNPPFRGRGGRNGGAWRIGSAPGIRDGSIRGRRHLPRPVDTPGASPAEAAAARPRSLRLVGVFMRATRPRLSPPPVRARFPPRPDGPPGRLRALGEIGREALFRARPGQAGEDISALHKRGQSELQKEDITPLRLQRRVGCCVFASACCIMRE